MTKSVAFKVPPSKLAPSPAVEAWVANRESSDRGEGGVASFPGNPTKPIKPAKEKTTRFTLDVSEGLHRRIKVACAMRGQSIADVMREVLEREFPAKT